MIKRENHPKLASYMMLEKDNKVLMIRRCNTGWHDGDFTFPAGHVKEDESAIGTAIREAKEEIGVDIDPGDVVLVHVVHRRYRKEDNGEYVDFYFKTVKWKGKISLGESCDKAEWISVSGLPENTISIVKTIVNEIANGKLFSTHGW